MNSTKFNLSFVYKVQKKLLNSWSPLNFIQYICIYTIYMYKNFIKNLSCLFRSKLLKCWIYDSHLTERIVLYSLWFKRNSQIYEIFINIIECRIHRLRKLAIYTLKSIPLKLQKLYFHVFSRFFRLSVKSSVHIISI